VPSVKLAPSEVWPADRGDSARRGGPPADFDEVSLPSPAPIALKSTGKLPRLVLEGALLEVVAERTGSH
jgi:hypothetical protein